MKSDRILKIFLLGSPTVGKTSLTDRYVSGRFERDFISGLGMEFDIKSITLDAADSPTGEPVKVELQIWDRPGVDFTRKSARLSLIMSYLRGTSGTLLVYDLTDLETLLALPRWSDHVLEQAPGAVNVLVGNKSDLTGERKVTAKQARVVATRVDAVGSFETSAKTGDKVDEAFLAVTKGILARNS